MKNIYFTNSNGVWHLSIGFLEGKITKDSDAGIGCFLMFYKKRDSCYGKFSVGVFAGRYLLDLDSFGFGFCNFFATGCGG